MHINLELSHLIIGNVVFKFFLMFFLSKKVDVVPKRDVIVIIILSMKM